MRLFCLEKNFLPYMKMLLTATAFCADAIFDRLSFILSLRQIASACNSFSFKKIFQLSFMKPFSKISPIAVRPNIIDSAIKKFEFG